MAARQHVWIGMFRTAEEATRVYDAAAWRFGCTQTKLNFPNVELVGKA
jgi:hypothetical protein